MPAATRGILFLSVVLLLVAGCGRVEPVPPTGMPTKPLVATPSPAPATSVPPPATLVPTATALPEPTSTATASEAPALTPSPEPPAGADVKTFGGPDGDIAYGILLTVEGGALITGLANNTKLHGHGGIQGNARLIKTDLEGNRIWEKVFESPASLSRVLCGVRCTLC